MELDEIFYSALMADDALASAVTGGIYSTCVEVPPTEQDNTPLPYIVITDDGLQNVQGTKDDVWEGFEDAVMAGVIINAESPREVHRLAKAVRHAIASYIHSMTVGRPYLRSLTSSGTEWDWTKPCYTTTLSYQCDVDVSYDED